MFVNLTEIEAYGPPGADVVRLMRFPERDSWIAFDCDACGAHTEQIVSGALECDGCDALARVPTPMPF